MKNYKIYIAGDFCSTNNVLEIKNPYDNKVFAKTFIADKNDLDKAITKAQSVEYEMKNLSSFEVYEILMEISVRIKNEKEEFAKIISMESGKPIRYALGEVERAIQTFIIAAEESKRIPTEHISLDWTKAGKNKEGIVKYFPIGLIAGISPFNFPLNLAVHKIAPAIASRNCIILKPSRLTPLSCLKLAKIIDKTNLPKGAFSVLNMDRKLGNQLVTDERFKLLSFTGSPDVGWNMKKNAGKKRVLLELGGNAGVIISKIKDIKKVVKKCIIGSFAYSGQVCIHLQRIYIHKNIFDEFAKIFVEETKKINYGNPLNLETDISVMIDENNAKRAEEWVKEAEENGAKILYGGKRIENYLEPTVLTNTKSNMKVCALEVFAPVVILEKFDNFKKGIEFINNSDYGLQAGIFSDSLEEVNYAFQNLEVGGVISNDIPTFRVDNMPYGGVKNSGIGREGVKYAITEMMEIKLLVKNII